MWRRCVKKDSTSFSCTDCCKVFPSKTKLKQHSVIHKEKIYQCSGCSYKAYVKSSLTGHIKSHIKDGIPVTCMSTNCKACKRQICKVCEKQCMSKATLATHMALHHRIRSEKAILLKCGGCTYETNRMSMLTWHISSHIKDGIHVQLMHFTKLQDMYKIYLYHM